MASRNHEILLPYLFSKQYPAFLGLLISTCSLELLSQPILPLHLPTIEPFQAPGNLLGSYFFFHAISLDLASAKIFMTSGSDIEFPDKLIPKV